MPLFVRPRSCLHRLLPLARESFDVAALLAPSQTFPPLLAQRCIPITDEAVIRIRSPEMARARTFAPSPALALRFVPILLVAAAACSLAWREYGSIAAHDWLPYAIGCTLLLAALLLSSAALRPAPLALAGLAALLALAAWAALSLVWSPVPELARDEALLTALYAVVLAIPLVTLRTEGERLGATAIVAGALTILAVATALDLRLATHPDELYFGGRLDSPVTYPNATAALFLVGFWPAIGLAARRALPPVLRGLALGSATALLAAWLLAQSKGGVMALAVSAAVFFAVSDKRLRAAVPALVAALLVGPAERPLTAPFRASSSGLVGSIRHAGTITLALATLAFLLGLAYAVADRRIDLSPRVDRAAGRVALAALAVAAVGALAGFFVTVDSPGSFFHREWVSFKHLPKKETGSTHLLTIGSNRYDFWRVALHEFEHHPLAGIGSRGFAAAYLRERRSLENPARAHSIEFDALSETGIVGFALLAMGIGFPLALVARRARRSLLDASLLGACVYWLAHASVDWIWTIPANGLPFFLLLGIGAAGGGARGLLPARAAIPAGAAAVVLAALAFAPPWLSTRFDDRAYNEASPAKVLGDLRWARRLDPLSTEPYLTQADLSRPPADVQPLERAVAKEPRVADLRFRLGTAYLRAGRKPEARRELAAAHRLAPNYAPYVEALRRAG